jgi:LCP family protein required for cell wall assembly
VQIPGLESHGIIENRIKSAYAYGNLYDVPGDGPGLLARTLADEFDLHVDHYMVVSFDAFEGGIDAIGGIDVDVPQPVESTFQSVPDFQAGLQHMDGTTALEYARIREESTDLYRIDRQTQVIMAIREKALSPQILPALPRLVETMRGSVLTDLSPAEISSLVCIGQKIDAEAIHTLKIDSSMVTRTATAIGPPCCREVLLPDYEAIAQLVQTFQAGNVHQGPSNLPVTQVETAGGT